MRPFLFIFFVLSLLSCSQTSSDIIVEGTLEVPENRNNPNSRSLFLKYKVLKALSPDSLKAPIVYLQGGPGGATLTMEKYFLEHPLRKDRDIVLMDQRGTGESSAICTDLGQSLFEIMRLNLNVKEEVDAMRSTLKSCKKHILEEQIDLYGYNSRENAADFEELRKKLGYKKWNLYGASYGSRLGLTLMRDFPQGVRSAVFRGIMAPESDVMGQMYINFESSLFKVFDACKKDSDCNFRFPNLKERLVEVFEKLRTTPHQFDYKGAPFVLNSQEACLILYLSLFSRQSIAQIPLMIEHLEKRKIEPIINALQAVEKIYNSVHWPMNFSVLAYEEYPFHDGESLDAFLLQSEIGIRLPTTFDTHPLEFWQSGIASDFENKPVTSEIPTLLVSGEFDPVTPPSNAIETIKHLKNGVEFTFETESHIFSNPCLTQIITDFIDSPFQKPNMDCSSKVAPIPWN
jgi:pimeloyl-ACP methyl ester carboxylesterase